MKKIIATILMIGGVGCASTGQNSSTSQTEPAQPVPAQANIILDCPGDLELPVELAGKFEEVVDDALLQRSLGEPYKGKLCQGRVYQVKENINVNIFRAWNSTNPDSQMGLWWAAKKPAGEVARYRQNYEICYQWSPLDKMTQCTMKAGSKIVVGTGQSAECSKFLSYPASAEKQLYIENVMDVVFDCTTYNGEMSWH